MMDMYSKTYGEILPRSLKKIIKFFGGFKSNDTLLDIGSGNGCTANYFLQQSNLSKVFGIEYVHKRWLDSLKYQQKDSRLEFIHGNALDLLDNYKPQYLYLCSTCFSQELIDKLVRIIINMHSVKWIITLKPMPLEPIYCCFAADSVECTWDRSQVYYYRRY